MHRVASAGNTSNSTRPRKEKRLTYVLKDTDDTKHCAGINCLSVLKSSSSSCDYLFTGSRDGTLKRWAIADDQASCFATYESHVDWVNDVVLAGNTLVSCSSDTTVKVWNSLSDGVCTRTLRQHSDYVTCLAAAEKNSNVVSSGGLGGEVFIWDIEAAVLPVAKSTDVMDDEGSNKLINSGNYGLPMTSLRSVTSSNMSVNNAQSHGYNPTAAKGHKESVYALAMNDSGTLLVSGGTEKVIRVWDPRTGSKNMKLRGHTDNIRALLLDSTGRFCLSGSSDSMIRLWDLGQQRCVHSYSVHTDSVWALASTPSFSHVYSGGRDLSLYLTDLSTRESILLCTNEQPVLQLALQDDGIWVATTDSSVHRWPAEGSHPQKVFQRGGSFLAGNLSFSRARADTAGSVKLWEITRGVVIEDYGKVSIPTWFTMDTRLGSLSIHLDTPQCFSAEMYAADLNISGAPEDLKINLAQETLRGLLAHWISKRRQRSGSQTFNCDGIPGRDLPSRSISHSRVDADESTENHHLVLPAFEFSTVSPPSIITEDSQGCSWRKKITELDGSQDEKDIPWWCLDCVLNGRITPKESTKCSFYLHPCEGSNVQVLTQGKLSAPRILRVHKVVNYVIEKMVLDKPLEAGNPDGQFGLVPGPGQSQLASLGDSSLRALKSWQKRKPSIEILCNNQVLSPDMSLATVRAYIWKKSEDLVLNYRVVQNR
ncbi:hypothetical protein KFK09_012405 [Dendrobium nobile]|uniref:WD repeat-containing protein 48 n=1 Tax=Dendrobium nobile TaxID=94219 RepID=A0A8T3BH88_DENNO|nr:hypothetical protein KFK09_012405 [Dendrobium nobile]